MCFYRRFPCIIVVVQFLFTTKNAQQKHILIELTKKTHGDDPPQNCCFFYVVCCFLAKKTLRILLAGDTNRLVAELTFVRINDLAVLWRNQVFTNLDESFSSWDNFEQKCGKNQRINKCSEFLVATYVGVSKNRGTPKSSTLIGFSIINHPFWGTPVFGNIHVFIA